jgi:hypothetical protein
MQFLITNPVNFCLVCVGICIIILGYLIFYVLSKLEVLSSRYEYLFDLVQDKNVEYDIIVNKVKFLESLICDLDKYIASLEIKKVSSKRKVSKIKDAK